MLLRATALTAVCALSGLKTSVSSTVQGNKEIPGVHHDANKSDRDTSSSAYNDPFVPRTIMNGRLDSSRASHTINDHFPKNVESINSYESWSPSTRQTLLLVNEEHQDTIPTVELTRGRDDYSPTISQTRVIDNRDELGILDTGYQPIQAMDQGSDNRRLQDSNSPFDCDTYCNQYDGRPLIPQDKSFQQLISEKISSQALIFGTSPYPGPIRCWNTSLVTNMTFAFYLHDSFNQPLACWDTSRVTDMSDMFRNAYEFNQPVDSWNTSAVTDVSGMFRKAYEFNQPVESWDTSAVTAMIGMFRNAYEFNQPVDSWDTSAVTAMSGMFRNAYEFNQCISTWADKTPDDVNLGFTYGIFINSGCPDKAYPHPKRGPWCQTEADGCIDCDTYCDQYDGHPSIPQDKSFHQLISEKISSQGTSPYPGPIPCWNTSLVTNMAFAFYLHDSFNQPLACWDTSRVTDMSGMFAEAQSFNQRVDSWDTSAVTSMSYMFQDATKFNQPVDSWDTSKVTDMSNMFYRETAFNQPVDSWDTSEVTNMGFMFSNAESFNQCISTWAGKTPENFMEFGTQGMLAGSGCPDITDPNPREGPWCQGPDICSVPPTGSPNDAPLPSDAPSKAPSLLPSDAPSKAPSPLPSDAPSKAPSLLPSDAPSKASSLLPSDAPSKAPSLLSSDAPSKAPSTSPPLSCADAFWCEFIEKRSLCLRKDVMENCPGTCNPACGDNEFLPTSRCREWQHNKKKCEKKGCKWLGLGACVGMMECQNWN